MTPPDPLLGVGRGRNDLSRLTIVPFDVDHAFAAGELEATLRRNDSPDQDRVNALMGDLLIAAVARELDAAVVTENVDDFETFDDVPVESY